MICLVHVRFYLIIMEILL